MKENKNYRMWNQAFETVRKNQGLKGFEIVNPYNKTLISTGISPTITTRPEGFKTAILITEIDDE